MSIRIENVTLRRGPRLLFEGASLQVHPGHRLGITGINGSGKSSLLALLLGELEADAGEVRLPTDAVLAHVAQSTPAGSQPAIDFVMDGDAELRRIQHELDAAHDRAGSPDRFVLQERFEAIDGYSAEARAGRLLHGLGFDDSTCHHPVDTFSGGWRVRLNLARALMCRSDILLLDEPTNHLDLPAILWLENWLRTYRGVIAVISHDREFMDAVCTHIAHIEHTTIRCFAGNYSQFERTRAEQLAQQQSMHEKQQREIRHIRRFVDRFRAKATKARQAQSRLKMLERMEQIAPAHVDSPFHFTFLPPEKQPEHLLQLERVRCGYDDRAVLSDVNLNLSAGARIGLLGINGAGKSTLVKTLLDGRTLLGGERTVHRDCRIGYFAQHQLELLDLGASPMTLLLRRSPTLSEQQARDFLGGFGFGADRIFEAAELFSGGEKARLVLALIIRDRPNLLLLDEPTNHLDLEMRHALTLALQEFTGALVLISHDRYLVRSVCDELFLIHEGACLPWRDDLDQHAKWLDQTRKRNPTTADSNAVATTRRRAQRQLEAKHRQRLKPYRDRVRRIENELAHSHAGLTEVANLLTNAELYSDPTRKAEMLRILNRQAQLKSAIQRLETEWLEASSALEQIQLDDG